MALPPMASGAVRPARRVAEGRVPRAAREAAVVEAERGLPAAGAAEGVGGCDELDREGCYVGPKGA